LRRLMLLKKIPAGAGIDATDELCREAYGW
jgi:hypothetical protein